jgi:hypothetical protein
MFLFYPEKGYLAILFQPGGYTIFAEGYDNLQKAGGRLPEGGVFDPSGTAWLPVLLALSFQGV